MAKKKHPGFPALKTPPHLDLAASFFPSAKSGFPTPFLTSGLATFGAGKGSGFVVTLVGIVARVNQMISGSFEPFWLVSNSDLLGQWLAF